MCLAIPGLISAIQENPDPMRRTGKVTFGGIAKEINLAYVPEAKVGDYVIVHVGFALSVLDPDEAQRLLDDLKTISEFAAELGAAPAS